MKRKGFILFEIIIGLCFLGILSVVILPSLGFSFNTVRSIRYRDEMNYIGEMVVEKLKSRSESAMKMLADLDDFGEIIYEDEDLDTSTYRCKLVKNYSSEGFIEYTVYIYLKDDKNVQPVQYKSSTRK